MSDAQAFLAEVQSSEAEAVAPETPSPEAEAVETPAEEVTTEEVEAPPEPVLYDLPDGRKVDGETLAKEWKDNFLPDYTRKSQELAGLKKSEELIKQTEQKPWADPDWVPQTYAEVIEAAKQEMKAEQAQELQQAQEQKQQVNSWVEGQMTEIRKTDPDVSEDLVFQHANKYSFGDLTAAYKNMKDMDIAVKNTEKRVIQNLKTREAEPIAAKPGAGNVETGINYQDIANNNETAQEALARFKGV